eukprot:gene2037-2220_t
MTQGQMIYPADLEEFYSIVEVEHSVQKHTYWYMQLKDQTIYRSYERFYTSNQTLFAFFRMSAIYTFICIPAYIQLLGSFIYDHNGHSYYEIADFIFFMTYFTGMILLYWMVYLHYNAISQKHQGKTPKNSLRQLRNILKVIYFTSNLAMVYHLIARVASGQCRETAWLNTWLCNPTADAHLLPLDVTTILMLMPLVYGVVVKGPDFYMIFGIWILNMTTFIVAMIYGDLGDSFGFPLSSFYGGVEYITHLLGDLSNNCVKNIDDMEVKAKTICFEAFEAWRQIDPNFRQVIIGLSANSDAVTIEDAFQAGIDEFLKKPFSLDAFYLAWQKIDQERRLRRE